MDPNELNSLFQKRIKSLSTQKADVMKLISEIPDGKDRDELNNIIKMSADLGKPSDILKAAELAKKKAEEIQLRDKKEHGDKGNDT